MKSSKLVDGMPNVTLVSGLLLIKLQTGCLHYCLGINYCLVFLNRHNAAAHQFVFNQIERIVHHDTGQSLLWRHLHSPSLQDHIGICMFTVDEHGGQAKGIVKQFLSVIVMKYSTLSGIGVRNPSLFHLHAKTFPFLSFLCSIKGFFLYACFEPRPTLFSNPTSCSLFSLVMFQLRN